MTPGSLRIEEFPPEAGPSEPFERVREAVGLYGTMGPEPVPHGATRIVARLGARPCARGSLSLAADLHEAPGLTGMIGNYEALDREAGNALLTHSCRRLAAAGAVRVLGPMNGSTWARYRLVLPSPPGAEPIDEPPFLGEPWNPPDYPEHFVGAGFEVAARYESRIDDTLEVPPGASALAESVRAAGIRLRTLDLSRFDAELETFFRMSLASFAQNPFYSPLDFAAFRSMYEKLRPVLDPEFVLIAEDAGGTPIAFQFAFIDPPAEAGGASRRAIVKTIATLPAARGRGLGGHMMDLLHQGARRRGCRAVVHALMHVTNFSMSMSARHRTREMRRYALYRWTP